MSQFSGSRSDAMAALCEEPLDVLVVGGGIVGSGVARDAAVRGLKTGLIDRRDFAFGTSSRSSRLLHGGLRYLAQGRIGLVREASIEKRIIHGIAPHTCEPLPFLFPTWRTPPWGDWALWKLRIGVRIYDLLCGGRNLGPSSSLAPEAMRGLLPGLREQDLTGGVRYFDGLTNDARLVVDTLRSAASAGALLLNYCGLDGAESADGLWRCHLTDFESGGRLEARARTVVNAAGPWAPGLGPSAVRLRLTKGVHLVIRRDRLNIPEAVVLAESRRILFAIPWGRRVILGTTDTDYDGSLDDIRVEPEDRHYVLDVVNSYFPDAALSDEDVLSGWAGVRPLIASARGGPSDISRTHQIRSPKPGWWDVAGGKLTTYRLMAQQAVDAVQRYLGGAALPCRTAELPLLDSGLDTGLSGVLPPAPSREAVLHYCRSEWALHLDDVMLRRSGWHYYEDDPRSTAENVLLWMREAMGWDEKAAASEMQRYRAAALQNENSA